MAALPPPIYQGLVQACAASLQPAFLAAVPFAAVAFVLAVLLPEVPLREARRATDLAETFGMPQHRSSLDEIARALSVLTSREALRSVYLRLAARADVDLPPASCWLLFRLAETGPVSLVPLARHGRVDKATLLPYLTRLRNDGLVEIGESLEGRIALTDDGQAMLARLIGARARNWRACWRAGRQNGTRTWPMASTGWREAWRSRNGWTT